MNLLNPSIVLKQYIGNRGYVARLYTTCGKLEFLGLELGITENRAGF